MFDLQVQFDDDILVTNVSEIASAFYRPKHSMQQVRPPETTLCMQLRSGLKYVARGEEAERIFNILKPPSVDKEPNPIDRPWTDMNASEDPL